MYKYYLLFFTLLSLGLFSLNKNVNKTSSFEGENLDVPVSELLVRLGLKKYNHAIEKFSPEKAKLGEDLVLYGKSKLRKGKRISIHFVCTDCHTLTKETELANELDPEKRLAYTSKNKMPFLPGSTLWGIYNRRGFYNDDYDKKYGDLIKNAKDSLQNATQVCAKYCSSGRYLEDWELEAIMHYYKKNELLLKDLPLTAKMQKELKFIDKLSVEEKKDLAKSIEALYVTAYPATFLETMPREKRTYGKDADAKNGEKIFESSCMYCHGNKRVTYLSLDKDKLTAKMFEKQLSEYNDYTLYQIIRWGTYAKAGRKQYMPHYTKEKMSDKQIEDLVAYIKQLANS